MDYLIKTSIVVALFYSCYYLFLQRDTFFQSNRWFLLLGLIASFGIPLITIPVYIEQTAIPLQNFVFVETSAATPTGGTFEVADLLPWIYGLGDNTCGQYFFQNHEDGSVHAFLEICDGDPECAPGLVNCSVASHRQNAGSRNTSPR